MQEWLNWHAWKACEPLKGSEGSNPSLSAENEAVTNTVTASFFAALRKLGKEHNDTAFYMKLSLTRLPETIANMAIILINQTTYLLRRQINAPGEAFIKEGGFRERMTRLRLDERKKGYK